MRSSDIEFFLLRSALQCRLSLLHTWLCFMLTFSACFMKKLNGDVYHLKERSRRLARTLGLLYGAEPQRNSSDGLWVGLSWQWMNNNYHTPW